MTSDALSACVIGTVTIRVSFAPSVSRMVFRSTAAPVAPSNTTGTSTARCVFTAEVTLRVASVFPAPTQLTTSARAGGAVLPGEGVGLLELPLPLLWDFFFVLELEQPPPPLLLLLLLPLLPLLLLPPCDENPVSANTTATSTAVNLM